jgi:hypothetical protein
MMLHIRVELSRRDMQLFLSEIRGKNRLNKKGGKLIIGEEKAVL